MGNLVINQIVVRKLQTHEHTYTPESQIMSYMYIINLRFQLISVQDMFKTIFNFHILSLNISSKKLQSEFARGMACLL